MADPKQITIIAYHGIDGINTIREEWDDLLLRSNCASPYVSRAWAETWITHDSKPECYRIIAAHHNSLLVGILAVKIRKAAAIPVVEGIGESNPSYLGVLTDSKYPEAIKAIAAWLTNEAPFHALVFRNIYAIDDDTNSLFHNLVINSWRQYRQARITAWRAVLEESLEAYLRRHKSGKSRNTLRRKQSALHRAHQVEIERCQGIAIDSKVVSRLAEVSRKSRKQQQEIAFLCEPFYQILLLNLAKVGLAQAWIMKINGEDAAFIVGMQANRWFYYKWVAHDENYDNLSIGQVLLMRCISDCCDDGFKVFDFGHGTFEHKRFWCANQDTVDRVAIGRGALGTAVSAAMNIKWHLNRLVTRIKDRN